jgi:hypothetical protein
MTDGGIRLSVEGGTFQGVVAQSVVIENLTLYGNVLPAQPPAEVDNDTTPPCPYSGLAYFGPQDSALFFGREAAGTGKSSVVLAGLAPRLDGEGGWRFSHFCIGTEQDRTRSRRWPTPLPPALGRGADRLEQGVACATLTDDRIRAISTI